MATAAGLILSGIGTSLSLISLITSNLSPSVGEGGTKVNVATGTTNDDSASVGGKIDIRLYDDYGAQVGSPVVDQYVNEGNVAFSTTYDHFREFYGNQAPYIKLTGNTDAICIAWVTVTWPGGLDWVLSGGAVRWCGIAPWFPSRSILGRDDGTGELNRPDCFWVDGDGSVGGDRTAYSAYLPYFTTDNYGGYRSKNTQVSRRKVLKRPLTALLRICSNPNLSTYYNDDGGGVAFWSPPPDINNANNYDGRKRDLAERQVLNATLDGVEDVLVDNPVVGPLFNDNRYKLVVSELPEHTASSVCESDTSWGPSFVSTIEGTYCDMADKTLYRLCSAGELLDGEACFDLDTGNLLGAPGGIVEFGWSVVERWTEENSNGPVEFIENVLG